MTTKSTPGPWWPRHRAYIEFSTGKGTIFSNGDWEIHTSSSETSLVAITSSKANAHLIAAAPKMLEALQKTLEWCVSEQDFSILAEELVPLMDEAIAKATQEES